MKVSSTTQSTLAMISMLYCSRSAVIAFQPSTRTFASRTAPFLSQRKEQAHLSKLLSSLKEEVDPGDVAGTDMRVLKYPHPALRAPNAEITEEELADGSIQKIAKEMLLVMYAAEGVGLAAPQVGVNKRLMVYNEAGDKTKWLQEVVLVNPKIVEFSDAREIETEGCLSFPNMNGKVERSKWIKVEALSLKGKKMKKKYTGWEARIFQHEYDHLDGRVYIDRLDESEKELVTPRLKELIDEFGEGGVL